MRDYAQISPRFWTGETGKKLRGHLEAQVVAMYLMSAPGSHMIGMYTLEIPTLCHHIGLSLEGAEKGLARLEDLGFAHFDSEAELVWVPEMAAFQISEHLKRGDHRIKGVENELENYKKSKFYNRFVERYAKCFNLSIEPLNTASPLEAPSKPGTRAGAGERTGTRAEEPTAAGAAPADDDAETTPEQKACRRAIAEKFAQEYVARSDNGEKYRWNAAARSGVIALSRLDGKSGVDPAEGLRMIEVFVERMPSDPFYLKKFSPHFIASEVNALRMPPADPRSRQQRSASGAGSHIHISETAKTEAKTPGRKFIE